MTAHTPQLVAEYDAIVVGAGPVGLCTAILLGQYGIHTLVVERRREMYSYPRAVGIDDEAMRVLQAIGIANDRLPNLRFAPVVEYLSPVGYSRFQPPATPGPYGHPFLATFLQPGLEAALRTRLAEFDCVHLREGTEFVACDTSATVIASLRAADGAEQRIGSRFLLACDGGRSQVRRQLGLDLVGDTQQEKWLVVDVRDDDVLAAAMTSRHEPTCAQPMVSITLPEGLRRIECRLAAGVDRADAPDDREVHAVLRPLVGDHPVDVVRAAVYERYFRHAEQLRERGVFLLGDAAHLVPPYGGQGLCSGIRDAVNLAWKIAFVLGNRLPDGALDSYQIERGRHMARTVAYIRHLARRIEGDSGRAPDAVELQVAEQRRDKPAPDYDAGFFDEGTGGHMFPQPRVGLGERSLLLDNVLGQGFSVLSRMHSRVPPEHWRTLLGADVTVARVRGPGEAARSEPGSILLDDHAGELIPAMAGADVVVLRPDRFVLAACADAEIERVTRLVRGPVEVAGEAVSSPSSKGQPDNAFLGVAADGVAGETTGSPHPDDPVDVLIVGAGPVGLTIALALQRNGIRFRIIDKLPHWSPLSKAMTLTPRTLECFRMLGVADGFLIDGILSRRIHHYNQRRGKIAVTDLGLLDGEFPGVLHLSQSRTSEILGEAVTSHETAIERGVAFTDLTETDDGYRCTLATVEGLTTEVTARYVVGADGSHSRVRELIDTAFDGEEQSETFIMADIEMAGFPYHPEDRHAFYLDEGTFFTILPIDGRYFRLISTCRTAAAEVDEEFVLRRFDMLLHTVGLADVKLGNPFWVTRFNPRQFLAQRLRVGGVFLIGDAAHIQSPIGAQGLNTGIQDAMNLGWKLGHAVRAGDCADRVLGSYHEERHPVAQRLFEYNDLLSERIFGRNRIKRRLLRYQNYLLRWPSFHATELAKVSQFRVGYAVDGLFGRAERGAAPCGPHVRAGERMPYTDFSTSDGQMFPLLSLLGAHRHVLLVFAGEDTDPPEPLLAPLHRTGRLRLTGDTASYVVYDRPSPKQRYRRPPGTQVLVDRAGRWRERQQVPAHSGVLLRPDGYVAAAFRLDDPRPLDAYLALLESTDITAHDEETRQWQ